MRVVMDEVIFINLKRRTDRKETFIKRNSGIVKLECFDAIDGDNIDRAALAQQGIIEGTIDRYTNGGIANALSHARVWELAIQDNKPVTIAEDDAILNKDFASKSSHMIDMLPNNWDIIFWGWNFDAVMRCEMFDGRHVDCYGHQDDLGTQIKSFQQSVIFPVPLKLIRAFGTLCYSISAQGAKNLGGSCFPLKDDLVYVEGIGEKRKSRGMLRTRSLDVIMTKYYKDINAYVSFPPLAISENDHAQSDVQT